MQYRIHPPKENKEIFMKTPKYWSDLSSITLNIVYIVCKALTAFCCRFILYLTIFFSSIPFVKIFCAVYSNLPVQWQIFTPIQLILLLSSAVKPQSPTYGPWISGGLSVLLKCISAAVVKWMETGVHFTSLIMAAWIQIGDPKVLALHDLLWAVPNWSFWWWQWVVEYTVYCEI